MKKEEEISKLNKTTLVFLGGAFAGTMDALINFPWTAGKIFTQTNIDRGVFSILMTNPNFFYRGLRPYLISIVPTTSLQFLASELFNNYFKPESTFAQLIFAILSGYLGALVSSPLEYLILNQQKYNLNAMASLKQLHKKYGVSWLSRGYPSIGFRDGIYAGGMLKGASYLNQEFKNTRWFNIPLLGELTAGFIVTLLTHPFDTIARNQQLSEFPISALKTSQILYRKNGIKTFYSGFICRLGAVIGGIIVMSKSYQFFQETVNLIAKHENSKEHKLSEDITLMNEQEKTLTYTQKFLYLLTKDEDYQMQAIAQLWIENREKEQVRKPNIIKEGCSYTRFFSSKRFAFYDSHLQHKFESSLIKSSASSDFAPPFYPSM